MTLLQQALEALEYHTAQTRPIERTNEAITALCEAIKQGAVVVMGKTAEVSKKQITYISTEYNPGLGDSDNDSFYEQAVEVVTTFNKASISLVQRKLLIGYNRAARLLERMEKAGVVVSNGDGTYRIPPPAPKEKA